ncbi:MAG: hypothetical protein K2Y56_03265 [Methylobacterium sp.]|uniref:DUF6894 family protein n=1 Tax=Methylobacterium sp. TaxID=409 RepID=UPI0025E9700C|nr:hypothetical protein [Methylobacterium sp.]MBX9930550.1 hypothetical protein [Methylobacterium sp.]
MPLYFFDVYDGAMQLDEEGVQCEDLQAARLVAKKLLPNIARDEASQGSDSHIYAVVVSDADHCPVYTVSLTVIGLWIIR